MVGMEVAGNEAEGGSLIGGSFEFARGEGAGGVAVGQQAEEEFRSVGSSASRLVAIVDGREVEMGNHVDDEASEVVGRQAVAQAHGLVERGLVVNRFEGSTHGVSVALPDTVTRGLLSDKLLGRNSAVCRSCMSTGQIFSTRSMAQAMKLFCLRKTSSSLVVIRPNWPNHQPPAMCTRSRYVAMEHRTMWSTINQMTGIRSGWRILLRLHKPSVRIDLSIPETPMAPRLVGILPAIIPRCSNV